MTRGKKKNTGFTRIEARFNGNCTYCGNYFRPGWPVYFTKEPKRIILHTKCYGIVKKIAS